MEKTQPFEDVSSMKSGDFPVSQFLVFTYSRKRNAPYIECWNVLHSLPSKVLVMRENMKVGGLSVFWINGEWWFLDVDPKYGTKLENILARKRE